MDSNSLIIILNLQRSNIILRRAILDAALMLNKREEYYTLQYDDEDANLLNCEVVNLLRTLKESPNNTKSSNYTT